MNIKEHASTILTATASVGVVVTGYFSTKLGMQIEAEKENLKSEDDEIRKGAKWRIAFKAVPTVVFGGITIGCGIVSHKIDKETIATLGGALAVQTKLLNDYRKHEDPERDKEIMQEIALENAEVKENDKLDDGQERWTDPFIRNLSDNKMTYYIASENQILRAAMYTKDKFTNEFYVTVGDFYNALREQGVDIPEFKGERGIYWEQDDEYYDYNGSFYFEIDWTTRENKDGDEFNLMFFSETNEEIHEENTKLHEWFEKAKDGQDLLDYIKSRN